MRQINPLLKEVIHEGVILDNNVLDRPSDRRSDQLFASEGGERFIQANPGLVRRQIYNKDNYLAFQNLCSVPAHVFFYGGPKIEGGLHIDAGRTQFSFWTKKEIESADGFSYYACPEGYIPVDQYGKSLVERRSTTYACKG